MQHKYAAVSGLCNCDAALTRILLPCATMSTFWPDLIAGAMLSCHRGRIRLTVSCRDSVKGISDFCMASPGPLPTKLGS